MEKKIVFLILLLASLVVAEFSCKKNNGGGPPVITNIRSLDTTKRDSFFVAATPGTEIVIEGHNLGGLEQAFFNDTSAFFNPVYNTNTAIIITIPGTAQTAATRPNVPNVIKLVTNHGTVIYSFQLYLPAPSISSIALDSSGTIITINGSNFAGIKKITFPVPGNDTALSYTVNKAFTQIVAAIPPGVAFTDSLRVFCLFGTAAYTYPPPMTISSVSNENAVAGTTLLINGSNFIGVNQVTFPGGLQGINLKTISVTQLSVVVPSGITAPDSLRISGPLGTATASQPFDTYLTYPSPGYLSTFEQQWASDNTSFVGWTGGYADQPTTTSKYPGGTGASGVIIQGSPMGANQNAGSQGNAGLLQLNDVPWVSDKSQSINNYSLKFEVYVASPWSAGEIWISVGDWYGWNTYTARFAPWSDASLAPNGTYQPTGWQTVTIPLSQLISGNDFSKTVWNPNGSSAKVFTDYNSLGLGFLVMNDQATAVPANSINIAIDNIRIVKGK
jgi:hypothetical protein